MRQRLGALTVLSLLASGAAAQGPLATSFTYQGLLEESGAPASGVFDLQFRLFDAPAGGAQVGSTLCVDNTAVTDGRLSAELDFGAVYSGSQRFLEIGVRRDTGLVCGAGTYTTLTTRQPLTAAPHAAFALGSANATQLNGQTPGFYQNAANLNSGTLPSARLTGTYSGAVNLSNASNTFTGTFSGSFTGTGSGLTSLNASNLASGTVADARLSANIPRLSTVNSFTAATNSFLGNVGIGTASPAALLHVAGNARVDGTITIPATSRTMTISAAEFASADSQVRSLVSGSGARGANAGDAMVFNAAVKLPDGAIITSVTYYATDNDATAGRDISFSLLRFVLVGSGTTTFASTTTSAGAISSSPRAFPVTGLSIPIDNDNFMYCIQGFFTVAPSDIALIIRGVKINYTVTTPLP